MNDPLPITKTCHTCKVPLPIGNFNKGRTSCKACANAYASAYYQTHKAEFNRYAKAYRERNPDKLREKSRRWDRNNAKYFREYDKAHAKERKEIKARCHNKHRDKYKKAAADRYLVNREAILKKCTDWQRNNPVKVLARGQRRRARKADAITCDFTTEQWEFMKEMTSHRCVYCGARPKRLTQDHVLPLCGFVSYHSWTNVVPACQSCNSKKGRYGSLPLVIADPRVAFYEPRLWPTVEGHLVSPPASQGEPIEKVFQRIRERCSRPIPGYVNAGITCFCLRSIISKNSSHG